MFTLIDYSFDSPPTKMGNAANRKVDCNRSASASASASACGSAFFLTELQISTP